MKARLRDLNFDRKVKKLDQDHNEVKVRMKKLDRTLVDINKRLDDK